MKAKTIKKSRDPLIGKQSTHNRVAHEERRMESKSIEIWEPMFPPGSDKAMEEFLKEHRANACKND